MQQQVNQGNVVNLNAVNKEELKVTQPCSMNTVNPMNKVVGIMPKLDLSKIKIVKKDGTLEDYNIEKVINAVKKSAERTLVEFTDKEIEDLCNLVNKSVLDLKQDYVEIYTKIFENHGF